MTEDSVKDWEKKLDYMLTLLRSDRERATGNAKIFATILTLPIAAMITEFITAEGPFRLLANPLIWILVMSMFWIIILPAIANLYRSIDLEWLHRELIGQLNRPENERPKFVLLLLLRDCFSRSPLSFPLLQSKDIDFNKFREKTLELFKEKIPELFIEKTSKQSKEKTPEQENEEKIFGGIFQASVRRPQFVGIIYFCSIFLIFIVLGTLYDMLFAYNAEIFFEATLVIVFVGSLVGISTAIMELSSQLKRKECRKLIWGNSKLTL